MFDDYLEETAIGPIQREEARFLYALIRMIKPSNMVEFGFFKGDSSLCFLEGGIDYDCKVSALDTIYHPKMDEFKKKYGNFSYIIKDQTQFEITDIENPNIDFVFIDASHNFELNKTLFNLILPHLTKNCIITVHDTGLWNKNHMKPLNFNFGGVWFDSDHLSHQPDEIKFVYWIKETYGFNLLNLMSENCLRHGISVLQRN